MLDLQIKIEGDRVIIDGLNRFASEGFQEAITRGLSRIGKGVFRTAFEWLSGTATPAGAYPVPVVTGHLRRLLDWLFPGQSKSSNGLSFTAGPDETVIYDSAEYARTIREGRGSSAKYGPRDYLTDAFEKFNESERAKEILEEEINNELKSF
ncbi:MAG: hypothetical protein M0Z71_04765 [Nitrospiraceae bacterium]|nr:hypothetical protein [Nitrospiraceae bacterium]